MKKFFFAALAAFALLAVSCDKDTEINESALVGLIWAAGYSGAAYKKKK